MYELSQPVQVSTEPDLTHNEVVAATSSDSRHLLAASMVARPDGWFSDVAVYASDDRGAMWRRALHVSESNYAGDPALAFGKAGTAYFAFLPIGSDFRKPLTRVFGSTDYGSTWRSLATYPFYDREYLTIGTYRDSDRLYLNGFTSPNLRERIPQSGVITRFEEKSERPLSRASATWSKRPAYVFPNGNAATLPDGTYVETFGEAKDYPTLDLEASLTDKTQLRIKVGISTDGGRSLTSKTVSDWFWCGTRKTNGAPTIAADDSHSRTVGASTSRGPTSDTVVVGFF